MTKEKLPELIEGSIYYINKNEDKGGYGFISSKAIPYERIFFHWSDLKPNTVKFRDLKKGMKVHFKPLYQEPNEFNNKKGYRAIQVRVSA